MDTPLQGHGIVTAWSSGSSTRKECPDISSPRPILTLRLPICQKKASV